MRRTIVVLSVLAALLLALTTAYAVENSTWGRIKASFVGDSPKETADHPQWLTYSTSPRLAKRVEGGWYREKLIGPKGGEIGVGNVKEIRVELTFPRGALEEPELIRLFVPEEGVVMADVGGEGGVILSPHLEFEEPVKLVIESKSIEPPDEPVYLWYWDEGKEGEEGEWVPAEADVEVKVKRNGTVKFVTYIEHFSRYALAGSRCH